MRIMVKPDYIGKHPPFEECTMFTLDKTDNEFWWAYIPMYDITIKNNKMTDIIEEQFDGKKYKEI